jgi:hypothetical protein
VGLTTPHSKKLIVTKVEQRKSWMDLTMMERVGDRWEKMEGSCSTGQSPQWAVVPVEEEEGNVFMVDVIFLYWRFSKRPYSVIHICVLGDVSKKLDRTRKEATVVYF